MTRSRAALTPPPTDPHASLQAWHYGLIRAQGAWNLTTGHPSVAVAVLDSGKLMHPDLATQWEYGYDFVEGQADPADMGTYHHGVHVAGTIGAKANNGQGGTGVCWDCKLWPVRVLQSGGTISSGAPGNNDPLYRVLARAIRYSAGYPVDDGRFNLVQAPRRASVMNISIGNTLGACPAELQSAVDAAVSAGTPVVVAAGNRNPPEITTGDFSQFMWGSCQGVISVAAVDANGNLESYSASGPGITLGAPGGTAHWPSRSAKTGLAGYGELLGCTDPEETRGLGNHGVVSSWTTSQGTSCYRHWAGTSMAAPHVTGTIGLMLSRNASLTPAQVRTLLTSTAREAPCKNAGCGAGVLDAEAAVTAAAFDATPTCEGTGGGRFVCYAHRDGGLRPFSATWTGQVRASIDAGSVNHPEVATGSCTPNQQSTVRLSLTDSLGRNVVRQSAFSCYGIVP